MWLVVDQKNPENCCNYCENFCPVSVRNPYNKHMSGYGVCRLNRSFVPQLPFPFFESACKKDFKTSIYNHYNIDSPKYIHEYYKAYCCRTSLKLSISSYQKHLKNNENTK